MDEIRTIIKGKEGRRLEFKSSLPSNSDLAKTVVAFANDAGGDIYVGVTDDRHVVGLPEDELPQIEEQISNMVYDRCYPTILPENTQLRPSVKLSVTQWYIVNIH